MQSIIPLYLLEQTKFVVAHSCTIEQYQEVVDPIIFPTNEDDFLNAHLVTGGLMYNLSRLTDSGIIDVNPQHVRPAMVFGNTIYTTYSDPCMSYKTYAHEITHVWQMQYTPEAFFGINMLIENFKTVHAQITNPKDLYNYGGVEGLHKAQEKSLGLSDFNPEQQANIVMNYYDMIASLQKTQTPPHEHPEFALYKYFMGHIWDTI